MGAVRKVHARAAHAGLIEPLELFDGLGDWANCTGASADHHQTATGGHAGAGRGVAGTVRALSLHACTAPGPRVRFGAAPRRIPAEARPRPRREQRGLPQRPCAARVDAGAARRQRVGRGAHWCTRSWCAASPSAASSQTSTTCLRACGVALLQVTQGVAPFAFSHKPENAPFGVFRASSWAYMPRKLQRESKGMQKSVARRGLDVRELRPGLAVCAKVHPDTSLPPPAPRRIRTAAAALLTRGPPPGVQHGLRCRRSDVPASRKGLSSERSAVRASVAARLHRRGPSAPPARREAHTCLRASRGLADGRHGAALDSQQVHGPFCGDGVLPCHGLHHSLPGLPAAPTGRCQTAPARSCRGRCPSTRRGGAHAWPSRSPAVPTFTRK